MKKAIETIKKGGILLHKTDTIWGLGCDATNIKSIKKIYSIKKRDLNKPLIILVNNKKMLNEYVEKVPGNISEIIDKKVGAITIIYPNPKNIPAILIRKKSIAIRITKNKKCRLIIDKINKPIVSTSANISGKPFPGNFSEIDNEIINSVDYILEEIEEDSINKPSSIYRINKNQEIEHIDRWKSQTYQIKKYFHL